MDLSPFPADLLTVELFYSGAWQNITADVDTVQSPGVSIERRRGEPSVCRMTLRNVNGKYSPRNPLSPLYGLVGRNTPIRVKTRPVAGGTIYTRFWGEVSAWPPRWTRKGTAYTTIECSGILRRLGQGASPLQSPARRALGAQTASVFGYWPCEDAAGARSFASALSGGRPGTWTGAPTLASDDAWPGSAALPVLGASVLRMAPKAHTVTGETQVQGFLYVPASTPAGTRLLEIRYSSPGTVRSAVLIYEAAGALRYQLLDADGVILDNDIAAFGVAGERFWVSFEVSNSGANVLRTLATFTVGDTGGLADANTVTSASVGRVTSVTVNPDGAALGDLSTGHWRIMSDVTGFGTLFGALAGWVREAARDRISRLCGENGVPVLVDGVASPNELLGPQGIETLTSLLAEAAEVGQGVLAERRDAEGLRYRSIVHLSAQAPAVAIAYTDNLLRPFEPVDDDALTRNLVTVQRAGGSSATVEQATGRLSTAAPPAGVGRYDEALTLSLAADEQAREHAAWRVAKGTVDEERFPAVGLDLADKYWLTGGTGGPTATNAVMAVDLGDRLDVSNRPPGSPPDDVRGLVVGQTEEIGVRGDKGIRYVMGFELEPERPYEAAKYSAGSGPARYGTEGCTLAAALTTTGTSVSTHVGRRPWRRDDGSYQIVIGGEVMTVTAVGAPTSTQTLTVTRSVNGVVKTHAIGAAVELYDGDRYAM